MGLFLDGVYPGNNVGVIFDMFDVASVEVLRGPRSILFGRNVTGGTFSPLSKGRVYGAEVTFSFRGQ